MSLIMDAQAVKPATNPKVSMQNRKLASEAVVRPHSQLREFISHPDTVPGHTRGMAFLDKMDAITAAGELVQIKEESPDDTEKIMAAETKLQLAEERIGQRASSIPHYQEFIHELDGLTNKMKQAVEQYGVPDTENIPFYRLLREEVLKKSL